MLKKDVKDVWLDFSYLFATAVSATAMILIDYALDTWQGWAVQASITVVYITGKVMTMYKAYNEDYIKGINKRLLEAINTKERHCFKANIRNGEVIMSVSEELIILHTFETTKNGSKRATYEFSDIDDVVQKLADLGVNLETIRHGWMR